MFHQEVPHHLKNPFSKPATIKMTHVTSIWKDDPAHVRDQLKKWLLRNVARRVELTVVN